MITLTESIWIAHVAIDHSHSQQPMPRGFPLFKHLSGWWAIATWPNGRHSFDTVSI